MWGKERSDCYCVYIERSRHKRLHFVLCSVFEILFICDPTPNLVLARDMCCGDSRLNGFWAVQDVSLLNKCLKTACWLKVITILLISTAQGHVHGQSRRDLCLEKLGIVQGLSPCDRMKQCR